MGSRVWPFGVTWRHLSRDHLTPGGRLPMGGPWWPCVYLAPLWRYGASNVGRTDVDTERKKEEWKEKKEGGEEGKGKGKWKGKWKGKGNGKRERGRRKGKERGRGRKGTHGKGKRKRKSWTHARTDGRKDARTLRWFYTLSSAMHCIGQTKIGRTENSLKFLSEKIMCAQNFNSPLRFPKWEGVSRNFCIFGRKFSNNKIFGKLKFQLGVRAFASQWTLVVAPLRRHWVKALWKWVDVWRRYGQEFVDVFLADRTYVTVMLMLRVFVSLSVRLFVTYVLWLNGAW